MRVNTTEHEPFLGMCQGKSGRGGDAANRFEEQNGS